LGENEEDRSLGLSGLHISGFVYELALAYAVHLGAADRARALCGRLTIFHGHLLGVFHFTLSPAL
jgi:hypothetical protein